MIHLLLAVIYMAFISLGLPDALLGSAWPVMQTEFQVPVSYAGIVFGIIAAGTIVSSLSSDYLSRKFGAGKVTAISVGMTAVSLLGFSMSTAYWNLLLWAIPYGLGAGSIDVCLNNYVALYYKSHHMSWLHCMWGVGASIGPYIMSSCLTNGMSWNMGYRSIGLLQMVLTALLFLSLPLWKKNVDVSDGKTPVEEKAVNLLQIMKIPGAMAGMITCFCYCALEQTAGLWASSYLVMNDGLTEAAAARFASMFYLGITIGRAISGFVTFKLNNQQMVRLGQGIIVAGLVTMFLPFGAATTIAGMFIIGLGCAPIYPCVLHSTPEHFGAERSQSIIGVQMASAYVGILCMPPLFGLIANHINVALLPVYLFAILILMFLMHENLCKVSK